MKNTLTKEDKELLNKMLIVSKKILKISNHLFNLEIKNQKDSKEYQKYQKYLITCIEIEDEYYQSLPQNKILNYLKYLDIHNLFSSFSDFELIINDFNDLYVNKRIFNKLNLLVIKDNNNFLLKYLIEEELKNIFQFLAKKESLVNEKIKNNLISIPYIIKFLNPNLINKEENNYFYSTLKSYINTFDIDLEEYNILIDITFYEYIKPVIILLLKIDNNNLFTNLQINLCLLLIKSFLLISFNNLKNYHNDIYDIINTYNNLYIKEKIDELFKDVSNNKNVIFIDVERLFNDEDSKRF